MSLTYPSVLGAIIYFFFDTVVQVTLVPLLERIALSTNATPVDTTVEYHLFEAFGLGPSLGLLAFVLITVLVAVHFSLDYLYSKYSKADYGVANFIWDTMISLLLASAYIVLSHGAARDFRHVRSAFSMFWFSLLGVYVIFLWWDLTAYFQLRHSKGQFTKFYLGMVRWYEITGIVCFIVLAYLPYQLDQIGFLSHIYVVASVSILGVFTLWFGAKVHTLETLSRIAKGGPILASEPLTYSDNPSQVVSVLAMEVRHIEACARIFVASYRDVYSEPWTVETATDRLREIRETSPDYCFTLKVRNEIAGFICARTFVWYDGTRVWLEEVVVREQSRGRGYGNLLLRTLVDECRNRGVSGISLLSEEGSLAYDIYRRMGLSPSSWVHLESEIDDLS